MRFRVARFLVFASLATFAGCYGPGPRGFHSGTAGSVCFGDDECESGLVCEGLHCARLCTRSSDCAGLGASAYCTTEGTCGWHCETTDECPSQHDCRGRTCIPQPVSG